MAEKKKFVKPEMSEIKLKAKMRLLEGSCETHCDIHCSTTNEDPPCDACDLD